jgi:hypothetical protein
VSFIVYRNSIGGENQSDTVLERRKIIQPAPRKYEAVPAVAPGEREVQLAYHQGHADGT